MYLLKARRVSFERPMLAGVENFCIEKQNKHADINPLPFLWRIFPPHLPLSVLE